MQPAATMEMYQLYARLEDTILAAILVRRARCVSSNGDGGDVPKKKCFQENEKQNKILK
jgi:hypothetical protein